MSLFLLALFLGLFLLLPLTRLTGFGSGGLLLEYLGLGPVLGGLLLGIDLLLRLEHLYAPVAARLLQVDVLLVQLGEADDLLLRLQVLHIELPLFVAADDLVHVRLPVGLLNEAVEIGGATHVVVNVRDAPVGH